MCACLSEKYEEKIRPCIDLIDSLRALGVEKDLALPAIAVIGDQSSGKSSVLESLSGIALPRGSGIVTRCPLELKMKRSRIEDCWHAKIKYEDTEEEIKDPADVEKFIREAQNKIAGNGMGISEKLISLELTSTQVPDLTLIDLPGITHVAVKDQPQDIGDKVKKLIKTVITKQETIILVVVPCNVDIATTEALRMAQEIDPNGKRTLGILTKPDLVDKGTEDMVVSIINNEVVYLNKGYMIVKCRGQKEINDCLSLSEATRKEEEFFANHPHFRTLHEKGKTTVPNLAQNLTQELVLHIERFLPQLEEQIMEKLAETQAELDIFGRGPPTEPDQRIFFLTDKITAFTQDAINLVTGEETKCMPYNNIFPILRKEFDLWKNDLDNIGTKFVEKIEKELQVYEEKYRGREFPGFLNFKTFEVILKEQIIQLEEPAIQRLEKIADVIRKSFFQLANFSFPVFPNLLKTAKTKIDNIKQVKVSEAESMLRTQFKMEQMIYTQDRMYAESLHALKAKEEEEERIKFGVADQSANCLYDSDNQAVLEELQCHLKSYYTIVVKRLADQVPLVIRYMMLQESAAQLQREMIQIIQDKDNIDELLKEEDDMTSKRNNLKSRYKRLTDASKYLAKY